MIYLDLLLALGLTLRLSRLITADDIGLWWVRVPAYQWARRYEMGWRGSLQSGLSCLFCVGFWVGVAVLGSLAWAGGPGEAAELWRWVAGAFTMNWVAAHLGTRLGDAGYED